MLEFHDPRGVPSTQATPYELSHPLERGSTIALMANGFPDSVEFLDHIAIALGELLDDASFVKFNKGNASALASDEMLASAAECDAVVAAYGH